MFYSPKIVILEHMQNLFSLIQTSVPAMEKKWVGILAIVKSERKTHFPFKTERVWEWKE